MDIEVLGGHTEITDLVQKPIITVTALGKAKKEELSSSSAAEVGDVLYISKGMGIEGSYILASDYKEHLRNHGVSSEALAKVSGYLNLLSVIPESRRARKNGVKAMHDVTEGGVLGALYEISQASNCGFKVFYDKIPILESTKKICNAFEIDPLRLISSGSMLIFTNNGEKIIEQLKKNDIDCEIIGKTIKDNSHILIKDNLEINIEEPQSDELWKII